MIKMDLVSGRTEGKMESAQSNGKRRLHTAERKDRRREK